MMDEVFNEFIVDGNVTTTRYRSWTPPKLIILVPYTFCTLYGWMSSQVIFYSHKSQITFVSHSLQIVDLQ